MCQTVAEMAVTGEPLDAQQALTKDSAEGQLAYREKRAPVWTGR